ncbi:MAG: hypothetical protein KKA55_05140 [Proteobacteria bacterium]|nr:hypothetical protein [Pseudomonadota bacterium]MBU1594904.1 hypothetical protein [Pseudomonadota bacterium]
MYGLTDNIVAGPAGHTTAGPAGSFMAGPAGHVTPAPAGHTPVYPVTATIPYIGAGYVPIDTTPARIPYAAPAGGGMVYQSAATNAPIPGPAASVPVTPATQGGTSPGGIGGLVGGGGGGYMGGGGGGYVGGGGSAGGGISAGSGSPGASAVSGMGAPGAVSASTATVAPGASSNPGAGPSQAAGMTTMAYAGAGFPPMELRLGQAMGQATAGMPPTPGTGPFTVSPGGRTVPSPVGFVQPGPASRFHAPRNSHVAHHPMHVDTHTTSSTAYQPYKAPYVWEPHRVHFGQAVLASDTLKPSTFDPPHVLFADERPTVIRLMEADPRPSMQVNEISNQSLNLDLSEPRSVTNQNFFPETRNLTLDNSINKSVSYSFPENRENILNLNLSQTVNADNSVVNERTVQNISETPARILNMVFTDAPAASPSIVATGGPIMARVA